MVMQALSSGATSKLLKFFLGALLISALAGLVLTDVGGFFRDGGVSRTDVAKVGGKTISIREFARVYQRRLEQSGMEDSIARQVGVPNMILRQEIERQILLQAAQKSGIRISNPYVAGQLKKQLDSVQMAGTANEKLQRILMQQKLTEKELVDMLRGDFSINLLGSSVATGDLVVPKQMAIAAYRAGKQKRGADIITVPFSAVKDIKPLDDDALKAFYKEHKESYRSIEKRDVMALILPQRVFLKDVSISDADVKAHFEEHKFEFMGPERVKFEQVILPSEKAAQKIIDDKPENLDAYKKEQFLPSDWYSKNGLPPEFITALYDKKPTGLIGPIKTSLGYHVLVVDGYQDAEPLPFDKAKETIRRLLKDEKLDQQMSRFTDDIDNMMMQDASLRDIAVKFGLAPVRIDALQANTAKDQMSRAGLKEAVQQRVQEAAFTLESGEISPLMDLPGGDYALLQVTEIEPAVIPELDTIKSRVKQDAIAMQKNKALNDLAESVMGKYHAAKPQAFEEAVKQHNLPVERLAPVTKADAQNRKGQHVAEALFGMDPTDGIVSFPTADKVTIVRLKDIVSSNDTPDDATLTAATDALRTSMLQEIQQQFMYAWQQKMPVSINQNLMQSAFGPQAKEQ